MESNDLLLNIVIFILTLGCIIHSFRYRGAQDTFLLFIMGESFGLIFPVVYSAILDKYRFFSTISAFGIPLCLSLFWFLVLYVSLLLAEFLWKKIVKIILWRSTWGVPVLAGIITLVSESIWDPLAVQRGSISFENIANLWYGKYQYGISLQVKFAHFIFSFVYAYTYYNLMTGNQDGQRTLSRSFNALVVMLTTLLIGVYFGLFHIRALEQTLSGWPAIAADGIVSLLAVIIYIFQTHYLVRAINKICAKGIQL